MIRHKIHKRPRSCPASGRSGYWTSSTPARWRRLCCSERSGLFGRVREFLGRFENVPAGSSRFGLEWACSGSFEHASAFADGGIQFSLVRDCTHSCAKVRSRTQSYAKVRSRAESYAIRRNRALSCAGIANSQLRMGKCNAVWCSDHSHSLVQFGVVSHSLAQRQRRSRSFAYFGAVSRSSVQKIQNLVENRSLPPLGGSGGIRLGVMHRPLGGLAQAVRGFLVDRSVLQNAWEGER